MKTQPLAVVPRRRPWWMLVAVLAGCVLGAALAWATRPVSPWHVSGDDRGVAVQQRESAEAQYIYALLLNTEEAWQAVWQYFPPDQGGRNRYYARRAQQQLARLYMQHEDFADALSIFDQLAELDATEQEFRAFGLAGAAIVHSLRGEHELSAGKLASVWPLRHLLDTQMRTEVERLARRTRDALQRDQTRLERPVSDNRLAVINGS
jgi:hypothetical protein